jgi:hypothetical protein
LVTEVHVTGWLANARASLAGAQLKRFIIEFPFVAAQSYPVAAFSRSGLTLMPCIRNIVYRTWCAMYAVIACFSWLFPVVLGQ